MAILDFHSIVKFSVTFFLILLLTVGFSQEAPYLRSPVIEQVVFEWETHTRRAPGSDNWPVTWAGDDNQYAVWGDGGGFGGTNRLGRSSIGVARIEGNWDSFTATNVWGGYNTKNEHDQIGKSYGILCVDDVLYMWVGMLETKVDPFGEVKIARSNDYGASWEFTPWSLKRTEGVMMPTFCNFGKNYNNARDGYVYSYLIRFQSYEGPDDYPDKVDWLNCQKPGLIDLARVPKDQITNRDAYSFFAGMENGRPVWTSNIGNRKPVFENPAGVGWCINVSYKEGLGRYMLTTEHTETHRGNIGIFDAPKPWGPWTTVLYELEWGKGHIPLNTFYWNFANKWADPSGKTFSLIFTGRKENDSFNMVRGRFMIGLSSWEIEEE
ncbi:MAG: DUF4185 domain-containing protein [Prolixibacteraceae bacterium]|nr:DUF4185 domain-containing protein [Prolixibacteraceae bacterium]